MNIVVLAGGLSTERDVSFKSGGRIAAALRSRGHKCVLVDVFMGLSEYPENIKEVFNDEEKYSAPVPDIPDTAPDIEKIKNSRPGSKKSFFGPKVISLCKAADVVFIALHGADGENGKVQAAFDLQGIKYTGNSYLGCAIAMNKAATKTFLSDSGVPFPKGVVLRKGDKASEELEKNIQFPCVVKPVCGGSSIGVSIAETKKEFEEAKKVAYALEDTILVEEYIKAREFACGVLFGEVLPVIEIAPVVGFYDYKNKYAAGAAVETCPADISKDKAIEMQSYAKMVAEGLELNAYSRMDFLMTEEGRIVCLEANTLPGMTPTSLLPQEAAAVGISYEDLCEKLVNFALKG